MVLIYKFDFDLFVNINTVVDNINFIKYIDKLFKSKIVKLPHGLLRIIFENAPPSLGMIMVEDKWGMHLTRRVLVRTTYIVVSCFFFFSFS